MMSDRSRWFLIITGIVFYGLIFVGFNITQKKAQEQQETALDYRLDPEVRYPLMKAAEERLFTNGNFSKEEIDVWFAAVKKSGVCKADCYGGNLWETTGSQDYYSLPVVTEIVDDYNNSTVVIVTGVVQYVSGQEDSYRAELTVYEHNDFGSSIRIDSSGEVYIRNLGEWESTDMITDSRQYRRDILQKISRFL